MQVVGIDHHTTDATTVARLGRAAQAIRDALAAEPSVSGSVVLATCARVEAYVDTARAHEPQRAFVAALAAATGIEADDIAGRVRVRRGIDALEHAFRVTAGLESTVVGEPQITGQVRAALGAARADGTVTRALGMALENALRVSRMARGVLGPPGTSIADAALDLVPADRRLGTGLVIGSGAFAEECVRALRGRGAHTVWSHSPSGRTAASSDADVTAGELSEAIALSDVVIAASGAGRIVIHRATVEEAAERTSRPLVILDLAGDSDVDPDVDALPEALVVRLDDVRRSSVRADVAGTVVRREALDLFPRLASSDLDDLVVAIRRRVEEAVSDELDRATDPAARAAVRRMTQALLHEPTERAREAARAGRLDQFRAALETVLGPLSLDAARSDEAHSDESAA